MNRTLALWSALLLSAAVVDAQNLRLSPLSGFGINGDGSIRPGDLPYLTGNNRDQRGMAYRSATDHLVVVNRAGSESINLIDGSTGADALSLDLSALISGGNESFRINMVGVADDGAIYVCNLTTASDPPEFRIYRWDNESVAQQLVFAGDPSNGTYDANSLRWGDTLSVRGSGIETQIIATTGGSFVALFRPTDETLTSFYSTVLNSDADADGGDLTRSVAFGSGDTFWADGGNNKGLVLLSFDLNAGTASVIHSFDATQYPSSAVQLGLLPSSDLLASIDIVAGSDRVRLYDISNLSNPPQLLDWKFYPVDIGNSSPFPGAVSFGPGKVYALNANNGILGFSIVTDSSPIPPTIYMPPIGQTALIGSSVILTAIADGTAPFTYQWQLNGVDIPNATTTSLTINDVDISDAGNYTIAANNAVGSGSATALVRVVSETLLLHDPFDYTPGELLIGQTTPGFQNWIINGTGTDDILIAAGNLTVPGMAVPSGNAVTFGAAGANARVALGTNITEGTLYYSLALRVDEFGSFTDGNQYIASLINSSGNNLAVRLTPRSVTNEFGVTNGYKLGLRKLASGNPVFDSNVFSIGETVFVVGGYTFDATGVDTAKLWINPAPATFGNLAPPAPDLINTNGNNLAQLNTFGFNQAAQNPSVMVLDEVRVGTTWEAVTPPGTSTSPALQLIRSGGNVTLSWPSENTGFILEAATTLSSPTWTTVPHTMEGSNNTATVNAGSGNQFFRLTK
ncbi:MAG: immunoglobulin domain-containing protein [Verrucomicrobia bacterium]|nr:immunoglobulin domain-containing protein [Verrucomicrobiota bacterium]